MLEPPQENPHPTYTKELYLENEAQQQKQIKKEAEPPYVFPLEKSQ